jgi:tetratricopeptide (TPR) repeat protein
MVHGQQQEDADHQLDVSIGGRVFALNYRANMELPRPWMLYVSNQRGIVSCAALFLGQLIDRPRSSSHNWLQDLHDPGGTSWQGREGEKMFHIPSLVKSTLLVLCPIAALVPAGIAEATTTESQANTENAARCSNSDLDITIAGCTALIQSGREAPLALAAIYQRRSIAYYNKGFTDKAVADETSEIALRPDFAAAYYDRGEAYLSMGRTDQAIADYTKAIALKPHYAAAYSDRGVAFGKMGLTDQAIADETQAIAFQPGLAEAYADRGTFYKSNGLIDRAIADCTKAIALEPDYAEAYYDRGLAKHAKGDAAGGDADITKARQLNPNSGK